MRKINGPAQLCKGNIYNRVYVGDNKAYAKINGKETFLVLETEPELQTITLYDQFGSPHSDDIASNVTTYGSPEIAFKDFELFEPTHHTEWFKKSIKLKSLATALKQKLITRNAIKNAANWHGLCPFVPTFAAADKMLGVHCSFSVENRTRFPLLQTVFIVWKDWTKLKADFKKLGINVRT